MSETLSQNETTIPKEPTVVVPYIPSTYKPPVKNENDDADKLLNQLNNDNLNKKLMELGNKVDKNQKIVIKEAGTMLCKLWFSFTDYDPEQGFSFTNSDNNVIKLRWWKQWINITNNHDWTKTVSLIVDQIENISDKDKISSYRKLVNTNIAKWIKIPVISLLNEENQNSINTLVFPENMTKLRDYVKSFYFLWEREQNLLTNNIKTIIEDKTKLTLTDAFNLEDNYKWNRNRDNITIPSTMIQPHPDYPHLKKIVIKPNQINIGY